MENLSQNEQIRQHLEAGKTITPLEALSLFGCLRLGARIHNLKQMGLAIRSKLVEQNGKRFAQYSMALLLVMLMASSCVSLKPGSKRQRHAVRMVQLDRQYEHSISAGHDWTRVYRNWWERPQKRTRIPLTAKYIF